MQRGDMNDEDHLSIADCGFRNADFEFSCSTINEVVDAFSLNGSDKTFNMSLLPRFSGRDADLLDFQHFTSVVESFAIYCVVVVNQILRSIVEGECLRQLSRRPFRCRMISNVRVKNSSSSQRHDNEAIRSMSTATVMERSGTRE